MKAIFELASWQAGLEFSPCQLNAQTKKLFLTGNPKFFINGSGRCPKKSF